MNILKKLMNVYKSVNSIADELTKIRTALGRIEGRQLATHQPTNFRDYEFQVYSQWGEDGLIQYLVNKVKIKTPIFIEFGVEKYTESNTRFLLTNNNWAGLVIDGSYQNIKYIKNDSIYWKYNIKAECSFIDRDNINSLIKKNGISGDIGLLSIDIDGNDYFIWEAINVVSPRIVVCEYNSLWGDSLSISIPYDPLFVRTNAHYSNLYFGASIVALTKLAETKGYSLVGSNTTGVNIFFVRNDLLGGMKVVTPNEAWIQSQFSESRDRSGRLTFLSFTERLNLLSDMPLVNLDDGRNYKVRTLFHLD